MSRRSVAIIIGLLVAVVALATALDLFAPGLGFPALGPALDRPLEADGMMKGKPAG